MSQKKIYRAAIRQQNVLWLRAAVGRDGDRPIVVRLLIDTGSKLYGFTDSYFATYWL